MARSAVEIFSQIDKVSSGRLSADETERQRLYRHAAAVLVAISDPDKLKAPDLNSNFGEASRLLKNELIPVSVSALEGKFMLHPDSRRRAIAEMATSSNFQRALDLNPTERTGELQKDLESYLIGSPKPIERQSPQEIKRTLQIVTWLGAVLDGLPSEEVVHRQASLNELLAPFETLAGDNIFRGRVSELDKLRSFVGILEPSTLLAVLSAKTRAWINPSPSPALSISGPGGIGKSALVARFMLQHTHLPANARIPFAYLDFDRAVLDISRPETLIIEMIRQLDLQFGKEEFFKDLQDFTASAQRSAGADSNQLARKLGGTLQAELDQRPFIIVLDTFEEVQYRGENIAFTFWELLASLQISYPFFRVIISGRAPVQSLVLNGQPPQQLALSELDKDAALGFLSRSGISDPNVAESLFKQVGGVPLSLKLAAEAAKRGEAGTGGIREFTGKSRFWFSAKDDLIQGTLYERILGRLHDPQLERLAHPGLVLRRITPAAIFNILNGPCELGLQSIEEASNLFDKLRSEAGLVVSENTTDGSLVHRSDLRRIMLKLLINQAPLQVKAIHQKAFDWYREQTGWRAKAEELYHRLQLEDFTFDRYYNNPECRSSLQGSISEFSLAAQHFLSTMGYLVAPEILAAASKEIADASLAGQIEEALPFGDRSISYTMKYVETSMKAEATPVLLRALARASMEQHDFAQAADLLERAASAASHGVASLNLLSIISDQAWLWQQHPEVADGVPPLGRLKELALTFRAFPFVLQSLVQALPSNPSPDHLRDLNNAFNMLQSWELWGVFRVLAPKIDHLTPASVTRFLQLVVDPDSAFGRVSLPNRQAQMALERFCKMAQMVAYSNRQNLNDFSPTIVAKLVRKWPFECLWVKPPINTRSFDVESAAMA